MSKVITLVSTKGSVGKTALAIHIGGYLASQGKKVCFIDADSQQSLSRWFDYPENQPVMLPVSGNGSPNNPLWMR